MSFSFVLGNGQSRLEIDANRLKELGTVYGCNAIYRDCMPDYLIAVDTKMIVELTENGIHNKTQVWTNPHKQYNSYTGLNYFKPSRGWSSGPTALVLASQHASEKGNDSIYILGFDYRGINNKYFNNVYADTKNYKKSTDTATYYGNWQRQTENVIKEFPQINFIRIAGPEEIEFDWSKHKNYQRIDYSEFKKRINY
jgi:hypothetical protein